MRWEEYYDKANDWPVFWTKEKINSLENLGSPEEVAEVICIIGYEDKQGADKLLEKAVAQGMKFTGVDLAEMSDCTDGMLFQTALRQSADQFTAKDLEELYTIIDDYMLERIAKEYNLPLPKDYIEAYLDELAFQKEAEEWDEEEEDLPDTSYCIETYDYVLECLYHAHEKLMMAYKLSIADMGSNKRAISITKHAMFLEAQPFIDEARRALEEIESQVQNKLSVQNTRLNLGRGIELHDTWGDGALVDWMVQRRIKKIIQTIESTHAEVRRLKKEMESAL